MEFSGVSLKGLDKSSYVSYTVSMFVVGIRGHCSSFVRV
jgi:hypothetical protein